MLTGIEINISRILDKFNALLWPDNVDKTFYGATYRNYAKHNLQTQIIPEVYIESTNDYEEVMFDDRLDALCFFDLKNKIENVGATEYATREVDIIFAVNLRKLYPLETKRAEEQAHTDVLKILHEYEATSMNINYIRTGLEAFGDLYTGNLKRYNMHPYYVFAINVNMYVRCCC